MKQKFFIKAKVAVHFLEIAKGATALSDFWSVMGVSHRV